MPTTLADAYEIHSRGVWGHPHFVLWSLTLSYLLEKRHFIIRQKRRGSGRYLMPTWLALMDLWKSKDFSTLMQRVDRIAHRWRSTRADEVIRVVSDSPMHGPSPPTQLWSAETSFIYLPRMSYSQTFNTESFGNVENQFAIGIIHMRWATLNVDVVISISNVFYYEKINLCTRERNDEPALAFMSSGVTIATNLMVFSCRNIS